MKPEPTTPPLVIPENLLLSHEELSVCSPSVPAVNAVSPLTLERVARRHRLMRSVNGCSNGRWFGESIGDTHVQSPRLEKPSKRSPGAKQRSTGGRLQSKPGPRISPAMASPAKQAQRPNRPQAAAPTIRVRSRRQRLLIPNSSSGLQAGQGTDAAIPRPDMEAEGSSDEATSPTMAGRAGIGFKGGISPIMRMLEPLGEPARGSRRLAAMTLEQLADSEDNGLLIAATGAEVAAPVMQLLRSGNCEEKTLAAKILARTAKVPRHRAVVGAAPGLIPALEVIFLEDSQGGDQDASDRLVGGACDLLAEIGRVPLISAWFTRSPPVLATIVSLVLRSDASEDGGPPEAALWGLASLARVPSVAQDLADSPQLLTHLVTKLIGSSQAGIGAAATAVVSELARCSSLMPQLSDAKAVPAVLRQVQASDGKRTTLGLCLRALSRLLEHRQHVKPFFDSHGAAMLMELLIYIRVSDEELLHLNLTVLGKVSRVRKYHSLLLPNGLVLQVLPLLQWGTHETMQLVLAILTEVANEPAGSAGIVGAGGVSLIAAAMSQEDCPPEVRISGTQVLATLAESDANRAAVARMGIPVVLKELLAGTVPEAQAAGCNCLSQLALTSEIKMMMLHSGVVDAVLGVLYRVEQKPECEQLRHAAVKTLYNLSADLDTSMLDIMQNGTQNEIGHAFIGARVVTRQNVRKLMDVLLQEKRSGYADIASWLQDKDIDKQEAAAKVVAKLPVTKCSALLKAEPESLKELVQHIGSWNPSLMGASASALCRLSLLGEETRATMVKEGVIPHLIQLAQLHAKEARTSGIKLIQRLAEDEAARAVFVDKGGMEALLDLVEHCPDPMGRMAAVKALTNLALSDACRSNMTARGLKPIVDMIGPEVSPPEGQEAALQTLQNMASNEENAVMIADLALPQLSGMLSSPHLGVKLATGKLLRNLACYSCLGKRIAPVVVPKVPDILNADDNQLIQMTCQLVECLCKRPEVRNAWIEDRIPERLTKILLLGDPEARHYAARALNRLAHGLDAGMWDRVQQALTWKPAPSEKQSARKPAWKLLKAEINRLNLHNELSGGSLHSKSIGEEEAEDGPASQSWAATIRALHTRQTEAVPLLSPKSTGRSKGHSRSRPSSRPSSAVSISSRTSSGSNSLAPQTGASSPSTSRPSSAGHYWQRQVGWKHRGDSLRPPSVKGSSNSIRPRSPGSGTNLGGLGVQGSLSIMRSPLDMTPHEHTLPRTKREAPGLWKELKGAARLIALHRSLAGRPPKAEDTDSQKATAAEGGNLAAAALQMLMKPTTAPESLPGAEAVSAPQANRGAPESLPGAEAVSAPQANRGAPEITEPLEMPKGAETSAADVSLAPDRANSPASSLTSAAPTPSAPAGAACSINWEEAVTLPAAEPSSQGRDGSQLDSHDIPSSYNPVHVAETPEAAPSTKPDGPHAVQTSSSQLSDQTNPNRSDHEPRPKPSIPPSSPPPPNANMNAQAPRPERFLVRILDQLG